MNKPLILLALMLSLASLSPAQKADTVATTKPLSWGYFAGGTIHVIASSHNDIAWFDTPAETIARRDHASITPALQKMATRPDVTFCMEDVLYLLEYLDRHPEKQELISKLTTNGQFDWGATYNQPYEGLLSGEQLIRELYFGKKLISKMMPGAPVKVAYNPDVPGRTLQMPQILAKAGVPYLLISRHREGLFNWASPDGSSVLTWTMGHYYNMIWEGVLDSSYQENSLKIKKHTDQWSGDYAQRNIPPQMAFLYSADYIPPADFDKQINEWQSNAQALQQKGLSKEFTPPTLKYSSPAAFFDAVSAGSPSFKTITGERPNMWLYIHGPTHHWAISAKREAGVLLPAAETFSAVNALLAGSLNYYPAYELNEAWKASIYDDHGWGGKNGDVTDEVFKQKLEFARDQGKEILNRSLENIAARIKPVQKGGIPVVVFNALSWTRTDEVCVETDVPLSEFCIEDDKGGRMIAQVEKQSGADHYRIRFIGIDVPSLGYKTYYIRQGKPSEQKPDVQASDTRFENRFYRIELAGGGIRSLYDKQLKREVMQTGKFLGGEIFTLQSVGNGAGEFNRVQKPTMEDFDQVSRHAPSWKLNKELSGPVCTVYTLEQPLTNCKVKQLIRIYNDLKRIDCEVSLLNWDGTKSREFRMALPLSMDQASIAYEVPMGMVEVGKGEIEGAAGDCYGGLNYDEICAETRPREVQNFITASNGQWGVTMSSSVSVCDWIDPTSNPVEYAILQPILLASRKSCHGEGNWYLQPGDHHYSFSILSHEGGWKSGYRFGIQANNPLIAITGVKPLDGATLPSKLSFFSLSEGTPLISTVKKCEDDNSLIIRLYDIEGKDSEVKLETFFPLAGGEHTNIIEEEGKPIPVSGQSFQTKIGHHAIETFKLLLKK